MKGVSVTFQLPKAASYGEVEDAMVLKNQIMTVGRAQDGNFRGTGVNNLQHLGVLGRFTL